MRLDSFVNTALVNTMGVMSNTWNAFTGQRRGWRYPQVGKTYHYNSYQSNRRPNYAGTQPLNRGTVRYMGPPPRTQSSVSKPPTINYVTYVFNTNYVTVGGVKSAQVGVHINNGNNSMNDGNFGNYGNNGNSGSHSGYSNQGTNGNRQLTSRPTPVGNAHVRRLQG